MRRFLPLMFVLALVGPVFAAEHGGEEKKDAAAGQYVDISPVALPIVYEGKLINYVFVYVRLNLAPRADSIKLREKEPYFRDALVRIAHRTPFTRLDNFTVIDEAKLKSALGPAAARIAGPGLIASVVVTSQSAKRRTGLPKPPALQTRPAHP